MKTKRLLAWALAAVSVAGVARGEEAPKLAKEQVLRIGNGSEPRDIDPNKIDGTQDANLAQSLFEGLVARDVLTLAVKPAGAESWDVSADGLHYVFHLRKDAKWSDGSPVTAHDYVYSWQRLLNPKTAADYAYEGFVFKNGRAFAEGKIKDASAIGAKAKDDYTLEVDLEYRAAYFLEALAHHCFYPVPKKLVEKYKGTSDWTKEGVIISNGPYRLVEWKLNQYLKMEKNDLYWGRDQVKVKTVYWYPIEDLDAEEKAFLSGGLDITYEVPDLKKPGYLAAMKANPDKEQPFKVNPFLSAYYVVFNVQKAPFQDKRVRRALALTVDRELLAQKVLGAGELPGTGLTPPLFKDYEPSRPWPARVGPQEIAEAKKLLAEAGFPDGKGLPPLELLYNTSANHKKLLSAIQQMWRKNLGIDVQLRNEEWKVYLDSQTKHNFQLTRMGWVGDYLDPITYLTLFTTGAGNNHGLYSNKAYDDLVAQSSQVADPKERLKIMAKAETMLSDDAAFVPIYFYVSRHLVGPKVKIMTSDGKVVPWTVNPLNYIEPRFYVVTE